MPRKSTKQKVAAAAAGVGLALTGGLSAAGALPGAAQDVAHGVLGTVGISVPGPDGSAQGNPDARNSVVSDPAPVSDTARTTTAVGVNKGAEISAEASEGRSGAGTAGPDSSSRSGPPTSTPPVPSPPVNTPPVPSPPVNTPPVPSPPVNTPPVPVPPVPSPPVDTPPVPAPPVETPPVPAPPVQTPAN